MRTHLVGPSVGVPHSAVSVALVLEEVTLVVSLPTVLGLSETPLHVVLPLAIVPAHVRHQHIHQHVIN